MLLLEHPVEVLGSQHILIYSAAMISAELLSTL